MSGSWGTTSDRPFTPTSATSDGHETAQGAQYYIEDMHRAILLDGALRKDIYRALQYIMTLDKPEQAEAVQRLKRALLNHSDLPESDVEFFWAFIATGGGSDLYPDALKDANLDSDWRDIKEKARYIKLVRTELWSTSAMDQFRSRLQGTQADESLAKIRQIAARLGPTETKRLLNNHIYRRSNTVEDQRPGDADDFLIRYSDTIWALRSVTRALQEAIPPMLLGLDHIQLEEIGAAFDEDGFLIPCDSAAPYDRLTGLGNPDDTSTRITRTSACKIKPDGGDDGPLGASLLREEEKPERTPMASSGTTGFTSQILTPIATEHSRCLPCIYRHRACDGNKPACKACTSYYDSERLSNCTYFYEKPKGRVVWPEEYRMPAGASARPSIAPSETKSQTSATPRSETKLVISSNLPAPAAGEDDRAAPDAVVAENKGGEWRKLRTYLEIPRLRDIVLHCLERDLNIKPSFSKEDENRFLHPAVAETKGYSVVAPREFQHYFMDNLSFLKVKTYDLVPLLIKDDIISFVRAGEQKEPPFFVRQHYVTLAEKGEDGWEDLLGPKPVYDDLPDEVKKMSQRARQKSKRKRSLSRTTANEVMSQEFDAEQPKDVEGREEDTPVLLKRTRTGSNSRISVVVRAPGNELHQRGDTMADNRPRSPSMSDSEGDRQSPSQRCSEKQRPMAFSRNHPSFKKSPTDDPPFLISPQSTEVELIQDSSSLAHDDGALELASRDALSPLGTSSGSRASSSQASTVPSRVRAFVDKVKAEMNSLEALRRATANEVVEHTVGKHLERLEKQRGELKILEDAEEEILNVPGLSSDTLQLMTNDIVKKAMEIKVRDD